MFATRRRNAALAGVMVAVAALAAGCAGKSGREEPLTEEMVMPDAVATEISGIPNAKALGNDLLFGGQPNQEALRALAGEGYRTVVNMRGTEEVNQLGWDEQSLVESLGMKYVAIPMAYPINDISEGWVTEFDRLMTAVDTKPMFVHCSSGNRVGGIYGVWLAEKKGVGHERALDLAAAAGMTRLRPAVEKRLAEDE
jgi:protein tyrosine phosphatase (PTP) superfamily phosphohydrolase (DUF442 family)